MRPKKNLITVKSFFEYFFSDENTEGVTISENAIDNMNEFTFNYLKQLLIDAKVLPCHTVYNYEELGIDNDVDTENLELVKHVEPKKYLKELPEKFMIDAWKHQVNKEKYKFGYDKFVKSVSVTELADILNECLSGFHILNEPKLKIKNIVIILPK